MTQARLVLHRGARPVTRDELSAVPCPPPEGRWNPVAHGTVVDHVTHALAAAGYAFEKLSLALSRNDQRLFGTAVLASPLAPGVSLAVGFRSSLDKSIALQWACGSHVFVCDNMAFRSELVISRKHTTFGAARYQEAICRAVAGLPSFQAQEAARIARMQQTTVDDRFAESFLLRCMTDWRILSPRSLPSALAEWREPSFPGFDSPDAWRLFNSVTLALKPRFESSPQAAAAATIRLGSLLAPDEVPASIPA